MTLRFLADENFDHRIVHGLQRRAVQLDIVTVQEVGLRTLDDPTVLEWAANEGRVLLTHDLATMRDCAYARVAEGLPMPGVFEVRESLPIAVVIEELLVLDGASEPDEWKNSVHYLPLL
ncbi:MAG: DUF5615 family PIN-like protein [Jiangellaceae bacterium]